MIRWPLRGEHRIPDKRGVNMMELLAGRRCSTREVFSEEKPRRSNVLDLRTYDDSR